MSDIPHIHYEYNGYLITTNKELMRVDQIHKWLSEKSYWAEYIPYETVKTFFDNSFCIGVMLDDNQIGFARLVTDYSVFAYLADVYIIEEHRGKGLSKLMMQLLFEMEWIQKLRRITLATKDAHGLYKKVGFEMPKFPGRLMEITRPNIYRK